MLAKETIWAPIEADAGLILDLTEFSNFSSLMLGAASKHRVATQLWFWIFFILCWKNATKRGHVRLRLFMLFLLFIAVKKASGWV